MKKHPRGAQALENLPGPKGLTKRDYNRFYNITRIIRADELDDCASVWLKGLQNCFNRYSKSMMDHIVASKTLEWRSCESC